MISTVDKPIIRNNNFTPSSDASMTWSVSLFSYFPVARIVNVSPLVRCVVSVLAGCRVCPSDHIVTVRVASNRLVVDLRLA